MSNDLKSYLEQKQKNKPKTVDLTQIWENALSELLTNVNTWLDEALAAGLIKVENDQFSDRILTIKTNEDNDKRVYFNVTQKLSSKHSTGIIEMYFGEKLYFIIYNPNTQKWTYRPKEKDVFAQDDELNEEGFIKVLKDFL
ncbi:hypothetical protein [Niallia sp. FSL R7-0271]|uniref:hypothetical protein n=1 Tax=Niallia sp. FSL R7-0271 TaxID=2921678 RepID=UPI0030F88A79